MSHAQDFLKQTLDAITEHIVVIDAQGRIVFVNHGWTMFGLNNACTIGEHWEGVNYLDECDQAAAMGDDYGINAGKGIRAVISGGAPLFSFEYPCHSPTEQRWFLMRVTPLPRSGEAYFAISHLNITERKLAEERALVLSRQDGLTGIANRRHFDEFLDSEWKRCTRLGMPISLAILDIDHFKQLNDHHGHLAGDECLVQFGEVLSHYTQRPSDLCARFGGEEFAIVYGNTAADAAAEMSGRILEEIQQLGIPNHGSPLQPTVTASVGIATRYPTHNDRKLDLLATADRLLYEAKSHGRNRVVSG